MISMRCQMKPFVFFCVTFFLVVTFSSAFADSAEEMLSACRPIAKGDISGDYVKFPQNFSTGNCWGAFTVIQKMIVRVDDHRRPFFGVCAPASSTLSQLIAVFVDFAEKNPQRLHEDFFDVSIESLQKAFPCMIKK